MTNFIQLNISNENLPNLIFCVDEHLKRWHSLPNEKDACRQTIHMVALPRSS